tara:strand:- start:738 stop:2324 length:1587 start_codon:yes stop_codon:yes gene_type:complete
MAQRGMIATSQPLASAAGLQILMDGGNAVDAAVTAAATLSVVEPTMTGMGGDLFAILHNGQTKKIDALNASGRAPHSASLERLADAVGPNVPVPQSGPLSVSVPGAVDGWKQLLSKHGTISLDHALEPAIHYARYGFAVSEVVAHQWKSVESLLASTPEAAAIFLPTGHAPHAGEIFSNPALANTLEQVASEGIDAFYRGTIAQQTAEEFSRLGGWLNAKDLSEHRSNWIDPIHTTFLGRSVLELPPNTQGMTALQILNLLDAGDLDKLEHNSPAYLHRLIESVRIAFADRAAYLADPDAVPPTILNHLLSTDYAHIRRNEISPNCAAKHYCAWRNGPNTTIPVAGTGDTVYLAAADDTGTVISLIQSLFGAFGSGVVSQSTGLVFQNRASLFSIDPVHPNCLHGGRRPQHTLIPALVVEGQAPVLAFGVMGGDMQAQGHAQVLTNLFAFGMTLQEAGEAARIRWTGSDVAVESGIGRHVTEALAGFGHSLSNERGGFGGFQGVQIDHVHGVLRGGSDPRKDGLAIGW